MPFAVVAALALLQAAPTATPPVKASSPPDRPPSTMTSKEIALHNAGLDKKDPNYVYCKREVMIGSLARKLRVCRTNADWLAFSNQGSRTAQELADQVGRIAPQGN